MKIINPIYDLAFKYLMQNKRYAKKVLSVILNKEVIDLELSQQETLSQEEKRTVILYRLDFKATIVESDGKHSTVLIELQKSKYPTDLARFRKYLGMNYMQNNEQSKLDSQIVKDQTSEYKGMFPIIAIYILGYKVDEIPYLAVKVNRDVKNAISGRKITTQSSFIELLTHQSYIIQIPRLPARQKSLLEKLLVLFDQRYIAEENFILNIEQVPEEFTDMAQYLSGPLLDDHFRRKLQFEMEVDYSFNILETKLHHYQTKYEEKEQEINKMQKRTVLGLLEMNIPLIKISEITGLTHDEIKKIDQKRSTE